MQAESPRHFIETNHHGYVEDICFQILDSVFGDSRLKEGLWQYKPYCSLPKGLNVRLIDT